MTRVIGAAGHTVDLLHHPTEVPHLGTMGRWGYFPEALGLSVLSLEFCFLLGPWCLWTPPSLHLLLIAPTLREQSSWRAEAVPRVRTPQGEVEF